MLKRAISQSNVLILSAGGMIGASWLFSPYISAKMAGPYALVAWLIISVFMFFIALPLCELGTIFPMAGGLINYPNITHGRGFGFLFSWTTWLAYVVCAPIEVQAVMQYASHFFPQLVDKSLVGLHLSNLGLFVAITLMFLLTLINCFGVKLFAKCNTVVSIFKFLVPTLTIIAFFTVAPSLTHHLEFHRPYREDWQHIFSTLSFGGIAFAFTGFQNGLLMAGEIEHPEKAIPLSLLGAVLIGFVIYTTLQWGFIIAIPDTAIVDGGWEHLSFAGDSAPLVGLALLLGLGGIAGLLMIDASVSPLGTTLVYSAATARILYAMGMNHELPRWISRLNRYKVPAFALFLNLGVGALSFLPFSGWQSMVAFLSSCSILSYLIGPMCLLSIRSYRDDLNAGFRLKAVRLICFIGFYAGMLMLLWCGFSILWKLCLAILIGIVLHVIADKRALVYKNWLVWFFAFAVLMLSTAYCSSYGGIGRLIFPYDLLLMLPISFCLLQLSIKLAIKKRILYLPRYAREHLMDTQIKKPQIIFGVESQTG
ncbi:MAG: APC family permease [Gammaproteobacteria bacterium]|nr:APC family permease [Gammaproteobacteria bacterium]